MESILDLLNADKVWDEFLETKINSEHLPEKVIKQYQIFIENRKYKNTVEKIVQGNYKFSIPKKVLIGKNGTNKKRAIYMYEETEAYILKCLSFLLYKYDYMFEPNLYSFRKNSGVKKAINMIRHTKSLTTKYIYKADIKNYFNSIPTEQLLINLKEDLQDEKLYNIIEQILKNKEVKFNGEIISEEKGIMAGVPISSFLANYYLKDLDKYFYERNISYARYADDIIFFSNSTKERNEYKEKIDEILQEKGLKINKEKEYMYEQGECFEFLGFSFNNNIIDLSENTFKKIKGKIRRTARGLRRWMLKKNATAEVTLKAMNRKFNKKFFGKNENDLTWKYWFFPVINTDETLKKVDLYFQEQQRYVVTGVHNKKNYEKVSYDFLKKCNYKCLVSEYYKEKNVE